MIADIIAGNRPVQPAVVSKLLFIALPSDNGIDLLQELGKGKLLVPNDHASRFDAGHIQNIVDEGQKMFCGTVDFLQISPRRGRDSRLMESQAVKTDDGVHGRTDLMAHIGEEYGLRLAGLLGGLEGIPQRLALLHGIPHLLVDIREANTQNIDGSLLSSIPSCGSRHLEHLIRLLSSMIHHVAIGNDSFLRQCLPYGNGIDELPESLPEFLCHVMVGIGQEPFLEGEMLSFLRCILNIPVLAITNAFVVAQVHIIDAAVVRGKSCNHAALLGFLLLLLQEFFLQCQLLLHFLLLDTVLRFRDFPCQSHAGCSAGLLDHHRKDNQQHQRRQDRLCETAAHNAFGNAADLVADDALPHEIGQHPVRPVNRDIAHGFPDIIVNKGHPPLLSGSKLLFHGFEAGAFFKSCLLQYQQQVILSCQTSQNEIGEGSSIPRVDIAEGCALIAPLQGYPLQHPCHVNFHEADNQLPAGEGKTIHRHGNDDCLALSFGIFKGNLRLCKRTIIKAVLINIRARAAGCIDQPLRIHKGKFLQSVKLLHPGLVCLQALYAGQIRFLQEPDGNVQISDIAGQCRIHHLLPPFRQLIKIHQAHGVHSIIRILAGAMACPKSADDQYDSNNDTANDRLTHDASPLLCLHLLHSPLN